jgi:phosphoglycolate phosphatase-like HAD superfamily hydrolase
MLAEMAQSPPRFARLPMRTTTVLQPEAGGQGWLDPAVAKNMEFQQAQRRYCSPQNPIGLGVANSNVELMVFDLDDTLQPLYGIVAKLNRSYLQRLGAANGLSLPQLSAPLTQLAAKNPDAVVHDAPQMVRHLFGQQVADQSRTQALLRDWREEKRAAFAQGVDRSLAPTADYFNQAGAKLAVLSNSPQTPLRERLFLLDSVMRQQGGPPLLALFDAIACKPDPLGMSAPDYGRMSLQERSFQAALDQSGKFHVLPQTMRKDAGIGLIKSTLAQRHGLRQGIKRIVQVGDRVTDLSTAHAAGATAVWMTRSLLSPTEKIMMRYLGERQVADSLQDAVGQFMAKPVAHARITPTRPHAIIGSVGYLRQIFQPTAPT